MKSLGNLFGGKIANISYNFSVGSDPSSCTITVVNESQTYQMPEFDEVVSVPPFNALMRVVEYTVINNKYKYLQVELIENLYHILDKNLILLYGEHTDHQSKLNNDLSWSFKSSFINGFPENRGSNNYGPTKPSYPNNSTKYGNGIHVLGIARARITSSTPTSTNKSNFQPDASEFLFDKGTFRGDISFDPRNSGITYDGSQEIGVEYGFYLKDLKDLIIKLGVSFDGSNISLLDNTTVLFSESGTIRQVLASSLSKIGMTFYVNPFTQKIHVITNNNIAKINQNIYNYHSSFSETCATTKSFTKSIQGIAAEHVVIKGNLSRRDHHQGPSLSRPEPVSRIDKLYRVTAPDVTGLSSKDLLTLYRFLPLVMLGIDKDIIESYIFYSAVQDGGSGDWGDLYGKTKDGVEVVKNPAKLSTFWDQKILSAPAKDFGNNPPAKYSDNSAESKLKKFMENIKGHKTVRYFDPNSISAIREVYKTGKASSDSGAGGADAYSDPDASTYISYIEDFAKMWGGIYISPPIPESDALSREYGSEKTHNGHKLTAIWAAKASSLIVDHGPLDFLVRLLSKRSEKIKTSINNITIGDLARKSKAIRTRKNGISFGNVQTNNLVSEDYHIIAIYNPPFTDGYENLPDNLNKFIGSNISTYQYVGDKLLKQKASTFLLGTSQANKMYDSVKTNLAKMLANSLKINKDKGSGITTGKGYVKESNMEFEAYILVDYIRKRRENKYNKWQGEDADDSNLEEGIPSFIRNIESKATLFTSRTLQLYDFSISEAQKFLDNFGNLNPINPAPFIRANISYTRGPLLTDFDINKGFSSAQVEVSDAGISTTINYSSINFNKVDLQTYSTYMGMNNTNNPSMVLRSEPNYRNAYSIINK